MEAIHLLEEHHKEARALFEQLGSKKAPAGRRAIAEELGRKLLAHMLIEQTQFYPAVRGVDLDGVHEAYEEHHIARGQIARLLATDPDDETFDAKVTALQELIDHHVKEEEDELFPKVRAKVDLAARKELGEAMKKKFDALVERRPRTLLARNDAVDVLADVDD